MSENDAIDMLGKEHKIILKVVHGLNDVAQQLQEGRSADIGLLREAVEFMREFADKCHHAKEEDILFPALVAHGVPLHGCPLDALVHEHKEGRQLVGQLSKTIDGLEAGQSDAVQKYCAIVDAIERLYSNHIWKEDEMVFPMAGRMIPQVGLERLFAQFEDVEARNPPGTHERFHELADRIAKI